MNKFKQMRIEKGYTLKDIAEVCGVSFQAVQQWETGETVPSITNVVKLASFYGCTVDELLTEQKERLDAELRDKLDRGEITVDEAEDEWHDRFAPVDEESPYRNW